MVLATLCYIQRDKETLMIHFTKPGMSYDRWNGVGGKLNKGESPEEAVVREVYEETGLIIKKPLLRGFLTFPAFWKGEDWHVFVFTARQFSGRLKQKNHEGELKWVPNNQVSKLNLWEDDKYWLHLLNQDRFFTGNFVFKDGKIVDAQIRVH